MEKSTKAIPELIDNLERIFLVLTQYSKKTVKLTELTGTQLLALKILTNHEHLRVSDLARDMCLHPSTIVGILDRLERRALITRTRSTDDRRTVHVRITSHGKCAADNSPEETRIMLARALKILPDEQFIRIEDGLQLMVRMLGAEDSTPQPLHN